MDSTVQDVHLFVEVRDARLPLTSINPALGSFARREQGLSRLIVYCRRDLGDINFEPLLKNAFAAENETVIFANTQSGADARAVLREVIRLANENRSKLLLPTAQDTDLHVLIGGMPNVGKSSLLNALRRVGMHKGKAAFTGSNPGVTRKVTGVVKVWDKPNVYIYDTPGIMPAYLGKDDFAGERALKIALCGGIKDRLFSLETLGEYLLWRVNHRFFHPSIPIPISSLPEGLQKIMPPLPSSDFGEFSEALAMRLGALQAGGVPDTARSTRWFIEAFRAGKLGSWALDDLTFTGPHYARLSDGRPLPTKRSLPPPSFDSKAEMSLAQSDSVNVNEALLKIAPTSHVSALVVSESMSIEQRVQLTVSAYLAIEQQRFLFPHPDNMSKNQILKAKKASQTATRLIRWQKTRVKRPLRLNSRLREKKAALFKLRNRKRKRMAKRRSR